MEEHDCYMEEKLTKIVKALQNSVRWTLGVCVCAIVMLLVGYGTLSSQTLNNDERITKINDDYAPLIVIQDIMENNDKMIEIFQIIPQTSKDDIRYKEAIMARDKFQREALQRASTSKRGIMMSGTKGGSK